MLLLRRFRFPWIALAAFVGIVSAAQDASASPVSRDRAREMLQNGCCCVTHVSGCCCESAEPISLSSTPAPGSSRDEAAGAGVRQRANEGRTCQCRSGGDPAGVPSSPEARGGDERTGPASAHSAAGPLRIAVPPPPARAVPAHASPPRVPLYLRTARLLI